MARARIITLTTDFGDQDSYVGQMKGTILTIHPDATIVDITHRVPPGDIETGAFHVETCFGAFPPGTIHVAVVDPGVGTDRRAIVALAGGQVFVGPDNGLFARILSRHPASGAWVLQASHYRRAEVAPTFAGRDVFAPAAAWIARGTDPSNFGPPAGALVGAPRTAPTLEAGRPVDVRVVLVDRFGNVVVDASRNDLAAWLDETTGLFRGSVDCGSTTVTESFRTYGEAPHDAPFHLFGSLGYLEVAVRGASAAERLGLRAGHSVRLRPGVV